jgi:YHS domain-containing protein
MKKLLTAVLLTGSLLVFCQEPRVYSTEEGAIQGYDPVAYFKADKPVKGIKEFSFVWNEATWHFSSKENLEAFKNSPETFAPQYGGYCAFGTSRGYKAPTKPEAWTIFNNKLYLNYNEEVVKTWAKKKEEFILKADENWKTIEAK